MINFYILNGDNKRECTATDPAKAAQILALMFHNSKGYVVHDNKVVFAQNMSVEDAEVIAGLKKTAPVVVAPKAEVVKASKPKAKKTTVKKKVVVKAKSGKKPAKKTVVKVKPKTKVKAKKPAKVKVNNKNRKAKAKNGKHR